MRRYAGDMAWYAHLTTDCSWWDDSLCSSPKLCRSQAWDFCWNLRQLSSKPECSATNTLACHGLSSPNEAGCSCTRLCTGAAEHEEHCATSGKVWSTGGTVYSTNIPPLTQVNLPILYQWCNLFFFLFRLLRLWLPLSSPFPPALFRTVYSLFLLSCSLSMFLEYGVNAMLYRWHWHWHICMKITHLKKQTDKQTLSWPWNSQIHENRKSGYNHQPAFIALGLTDITPFTYLKKFKWMQQTILKMNFDMKLHLKLISSVSITFSHKKSHM